MKSLNLTFCLAALIISCTYSSDSKVEIVKPAKVELKKINNEVSKPSVAHEGELLIHYDSDDSDYGETHLKLFNNQTFLFEWEIYGEGGQSTNEEYISKQGKWELEKDSSVTLLFDDNKHILNLFYTDREYEKDFTFIDSKTLRFDLKKTDIHIDGFLLTDFKRNCYCEK